MIAVSGGTIGLLLLMVFRVTGKALGKINPLQTAAIYQSTDGTENSNIVQQYFQTTLSRRSNFQGVINRIIYFKRSVI